MARLQQITVWEEAGPYLQMLRDTVGNDIRPLLVTEGGAPFAIFREVMSYIDYLGYLYTGLGEGKSARRLVQFLEDVSAKVDPSYKTWARVVYQMYRCGPVHEFAPKILQNDRGQTLAWQSYRGGRKNHNDVFYEKPIVVSHLEPLQDNGRPFWWLPVSSDCLVEDLEASIDIFSGLPDHVERIDAWNRAAKRLGPPQSFNFSI
jgi:hypothetical protein